MLFEGSRGTALTTLQCSQKPNESMVSPCVPALTSFTGSLSFSTVLPGGCPSCDNNALQEASLCLERHYAAFPLPNRTTFNSSLTFLENAADVGGLSIAWQVIYMPKAWFYQQDYFLLFFSPSLLQM